MDTPFAIWTVHSKYRQTVIHTKVVKIKKKKVDLTFRKFMRNEYTSDRKYQAKFIIT